MSERSVLIELGRLHCADCLATLSDVVLPKMPGVIGTSVSDGALHVSIDDDVLSEQDLVARLTDAGLLR